MVHKSSTLERVMSLIESRGTSLANPGICLACGEDADGCEPDASKYECECCEQRKVYAPEEILIMGLV